MSLLQLYRWGKSGLQSEPQIYEHWQMGTCPQCIFIWIWLVILIPQQIHSERHPSFHLVLSSSARELTHHLAFHLSRPSKCIYYHHTYHPHPVSSVSLTLSFLQIYPVSALSNPFSKQQPEKGFDGALKEKKIQSTSQSTRLCLILSLLCWHVPFEAPIIVSNYWTVFSTHCTGLPQTRVNSMFRG